MNYILQTLGANHHILITLILILYFTINTILAGEYFHDFETYKYLKTALIYFFGVPYFIFMVFKALAWRFINDYFQIPFFYNFYFTDKYKKVDPVLIEDFEKWKSKLGKSLKDRINKRGLDLLIKRAKS